MADVYIHCSATPLNQFVDAETIRRWHKARGWTDIGYHAVILPNGHIEGGRKWQLNGAHVRGRNGGTIGICMVGGLNEDGTPGEVTFDDGGPWCGGIFTLAQFESLKVLCGLMKRANRNQRFFGHRDASPDLDGDGVITEKEWMKNCPCFSVADFLTWAGIT